MIIKSRRLTIILLTFDENYLPLIIFSIFAFDGVFQFCIKIQIIIYFWFYNVCDWNSHSFPLWRAFQKLDVCARHIDDHLSFHKNKILLERHVRMMYNPHAHCIKTMEVDFVREGRRGRRGGKIRKFEVETFNQLCWPPVGDC